MYTLDGKYFLFTKNLFIDVVEKCLYGRDSAKNLSVTRPRKMYAEVMKKIECN